MIGIEEERVYRLRIECEHACDDRVVEACERPTDYARQLVNLARLLRLPRLGMTIAMARTSTYLNFPGNTEAAFRLYSSVFGTEFTSPIHRMGDVPAAPGIRPSLTSGWPT